METMTSAEPRAWIGCLGCYNSGRLNGRWMDADDAEEVGGKCDRCFSDEWWCFDVENVLKVREISPAEFVRDARLAEVIDEHPNADALRVWVAGDFRYNVEQRDFDPVDIIDTFEQSFDGEFETFADFAYEWADNYLGKSDEADAVLVIDWEATGRNLADGYNVVRHDGSLYFFRTDVG